MKYPLLLTDLLSKNVIEAVQPLIYVPFFNRVSGVGGFMFRAWWGRLEMQSPQRTDSVGHGMIVLDKIDLNPVLG